MDTILLAVALVFSAVSLVVCALIYKKLGERDGLKKADLAKELAELRRQSDESQSRLRREQAETLNSSVTSLGNMLSANQKAADEAMVKQLDAMQRSLSDSFVATEERFKTFAADNRDQLEKMRLTVEKRLVYLQDDNNKKLDEMRRIVDEKLEERMTKSFEKVSAQLESVYKGLGEMQNLAVGVGDLKKVLSGVKTRGILGEVQLGAILEQILAPEQYATNVAVKPNSADRVEFAVKLPAEDDSFIYLPIDSKFPMDTYAHLQKAIETGDPAAVAAAWNVLAATIKNEAKKIRDKYICPPHTTDYAIMFLPFEGLYAEVVSRGLLEELQRLYRVNVAGPSTMAALLNSLYMGFRTVAIQKRSGEVWQVLGAVRTEFDNFAKVLDDTQKHLNQVSGDLDKLVGVRTRQIQRKLKSVERLTPEQSAGLLDGVDGLPE